MKSIEEHSNILKKEFEEEKYVLAIHPSYKGNIIAIVDKELLGKYFEDKDLILDLRSPFYKGKQVTFNEIKEAIRECFTANIVGNSIIEKLISKKIIHRKNVKEIKGIKYIHLYHISE